MPKKKSTTKILSFEKFIDKSSGSVGKRIILFLKNQSKYIFYGLLIILLSIFIAYMVTK